MAATVIINRWTGTSGSPTKTNITSINTVANAQDAHETTAASSSNPIRVPDSGTNYSYWVVTRLNCTVAPAGTIDNIRWYTDGSNGFGTGIGCNVGKASSYVQATGTVGVTGNLLSTSNYATLSYGPQNAFDFNSTSPLPVSGSTSGTGDFGDYLVYQLTVGTSAAPGTTGQESFTWIYDET